MYMITTYKNGAIWLKSIYVDIYSNGTLVVYYYLSLRRMFSDFFTFIQTKVCGFFFLV